jgi:ParB-like chromosome segregation protein Spo0J
MERVPTSAIATIIASLFLFVGGGEPAAEGTSHVAETGAGNDQHQASETADQGLRAPFERSTVIRLNEIVGRSLATIRAYDRDIDAIRETVRASVENDADTSEVAAAAQSLEKLEQWTAVSRQAQKDLRTAERAMKKSGEYYNKTIFAGMTRFVETVAAEIDREYATLSSLRRHSDDKAQSRESE